MKGRAWLRAAVVALALVAAVPAPALTHDIAPGQGPHVLVHLAAPIGEAGEKALASAVGGTVDGRIDPLRIVRIRLAPGDDPAVAAAALERRPGVRLVEADHTARLETAPNDPLWSTDPYTPGEGQWGMRVTKVDQAWDLVKPSASVIVAVVDTGIDDTHPDLAGVTVPGVAFVSSPSDGCGTTTRDENSHGTHVAGIIAANANNGIGIAGAAAGVRIMPIRALDCSGVGSTSDIAMGIVWATDHGAKIVSISLGASEDDATMSSAVEYAIAHGVLVVAAAGNCGAPSSACFNIVDRIDYPAAYPGVLAVGATTESDTIASFSTQGPQVAIAAPGVRIVSTTPTYPTYQSTHSGTPLRYASFSGTSQATPLVAAIAALVWSADPSLTATQVAGRLESTADDLGAPGRDDAYGFGRVNALRAVSASVQPFAATYDTSAVPHAAATTDAFTARVTLTNTSSTVWSATGSAPVTLGYHWIDAKGAPVVWDGQRTNLPRDVPKGGTLRVDATVTAPATPGAYTLRFDLVRGGGEWFSQRGAAGGDVRVVVGSGMDATYAAPASTSSLVTSAPAPLAVTLTNTGTRAWPAGGVHPVRLAYHWLDPSGKVVVWDGVRAAAFAADVQPGQSVSVQLPIAAPLRPGSYRLRLDLVQEGVAWFSDDGVPPMEIGYLVTTGLRGAYAPAAASGALFTGVPGTLAVTLTNTGTRAWPAGGVHPVRLAYHWLDPSGKVVVWDGVRAAAFAADVQPGQSVSVQLPIAAPLRPGSYRLRLDLVQEGVAWFSDDGVPPTDVPFAVIPTAPRPPAPRPTAPPVDPQAILVPSEWMVSHF